MRPRDRDGLGRPRNARPRDALGRPLAPGSVDALAELAEEIAEWQAAAPETQLAGAQRLLDAGRPFAAHEVLEAAWKRAPDGERDLWRALAQLAVGVTHRRRGNGPGAVALFRRSADTFERFAVRPDPPPYSIDVRGLAGKARRLEAGDPDLTLRLTS